MGYTFVTSGEGSQNSGTNINLDANLSSTPQANDLVVALIHVNNNGQTITEGSGNGAAFTWLYQNIDNIGAETATYSVAWKTAGASEPNNYNWDYTTSTRASTKIYVFRPSTGENYDSNKTNGSNSSSSNIAVAQITAPANGVAVAFGMMDRNNTGGSADNGYLGFLDSTTQKSVGAYKLFAAETATSMNFNSVGATDASYFAHVSFTEDNPAAGGGLILPHRLSTRQMQHLLGR